MIFPRFRRNPRPDTISTLYGMIVAQARLPCFYRDYAVADTVNGRFDLIVLHLAMVMDRISREPGLQALGQGIFDHFCGDMDHNLREMGVSDLKVPKEMQRMGEAYYGRAQAYRTAWNSEDAAVLAETLERNIYGGSVPRSHLTVRLAAYVREGQRTLSRLSAADLAAGIMSFPDPSKIAATEA